MKTSKPTDSIQVRDTAELKKLVIANAIATGNTFAFHHLFSCLKEFGGDTSDVSANILSRLNYLLPNEEMMDSPKFRTAMELVEKYELQDDTIPAILLEATAKEAVTCGKFAYAEDAYKLLGIKKEIVALYAQTGEQLLRENKPKHAAMAFFTAASIEQPIGPHYQYLALQLHSRCTAEPHKCVTMLPLDALIETGIRFLLGNDALAQKLNGLAAPAQKQQVLATLALCRDFDLNESVRNLRATVAALAKIEDGKPDDYLPLGLILLGRETGAGESWQYLKEFCFEHPIGALCVCMRAMRDRLVLIPAIRDGKSLIEALLPPEFLPQ